MSRNGKVNMSRNPTSPVKAHIVAALALLGALLSHYGLAWSMFGMGHASHARNYAGYAIVVLSPFLAIFLIAFAASGRMRVRSEWRSSLIYGLVAFLTGPLWYFLIQNALYRIAPALCAFPPPLGWG